jgi:hypothetical protein
MQDTIAFVPEAHRDYVLIFEESWPGATLLLMMLVAAAAVGSWLLFRRRGRGQD